MFNRWGWLTAALLAAALSGCASGEKKDGGAPPAEGGNPPATTGDAGGAPPAGGEADKPKMEGTAGGEMGQPPAGGDAGGAPPAGGGAAPPPAAAGPLALMATWTPDKKVAIKSGNDDVAMLDPATPGVNDAVVNYLKAKHDAGANKVTITCAADMNFDAVGMQLMKAAFKAGFSPKGDVTYQAGK